jgi:uncharacterized OsmC-like protein
VTRLHPRAAAGTVHQQRFAQDEVEDDADAIKKKNRQQRPHDVAHAAAACISIDVPNQ